MYLTEYRTSLILTVTFYFDSLRLALIYFAELFA